MIANGRLDENLHLHILISLAANLARSPGSKEQDEKNSNEQAKSADSESIDVLLQGLPRPSGSPPDDSPAITGIPGAETRETWVRSCDLHHATTLSQIGLTLDRIRNQPRSLLRALCRFPTTDIPAPLTVPFNPPTAAL